MLLAAAWLRDARTRNNANTGMPRCTSTPRYHASRAMARMPALSWRVPTLSPYFVPLRVPFPSTITLPARGLHTLHATAAISPYPSLPLLRRRAFSSLRLRAQTHMPRPAYAFTMPCIAYQRTLLHACRCAFRAALAYAAPWLCAQRVARCCRCVA